MEDGISVSGRLKSSSDNAIIPNQLVLLSAPGTVPPFQQQYTDESGNFYFSGLQFDNAKDLFLQIPSTIHNIPVRMEADTLHDLRFPERFVYPAIDPRELSAYIEKSRNRAKIESYYKREEADTLFITASNPGKEKANRYALVDAAPDHNIALDKYNEFPDMTEVLREIVPGILLQSKKGVINGLRILDIKRKLYFKENPMFFIDGIPVYKAEDIP